MRILFLNPGGFVGGAERVLLEIIRILRDARPSWELHLVAGGDGPLVEGAAALGAAVRVLAMPDRIAAVGDSTTSNARRRDVARVGVELAAAAPASLGYVRTLRGAMRKISPSLVHTNGIKMHIVGALAASSKTPLVWHIHDFVGRRKYSTRLMRAAARKCRAAIANSESVRRDFIDAIGSRPECITVFNPVNLDHFKPAGPRADLDALSGLARAGEGTIRVGMVATMARWKGHEVFIRALAALADRLPLRGYIVGGPIYATRASQYSIAELRAMVAALGMSHRIGLTGHLDDVASALRALDVVVNASIEPEPFGLAIVEAMACGRAVIAADAGGAAEIARLGAGLVLHRPGDIEGLAREIARLAESRDARAALASAGMMTVRRTFSAEKFAQRIIPIYERLGAATS